MRRRQCGHRQRLQVRCGAAQTRGRMRGLALRPDRPVCNRDAFCASAVGATRPRHDGAPGNSGLWVLGVFHWGESTGTATLTARAVTLTVTLTATTVRTASRTARVVTVTTRSACQFFQFVQNGRVGVVPGWRAISFADVDGRDAQRQACASTPVAKRTGVFGYSVIRWMSRALWLTRPTPCRLHFHMIWCWGSTSFTSNM